MASAEGLNDLLVQALCSLDKETCLGVGLLPVNEEAQTWNLYTVRCAGNSREPRG